MNILWVTDLYPSSPTDTFEQTSRALHDYSIEWLEAGHRVGVLSPFDLRRKLGRGDRPVPAEIDGVVVIPVQCFRIPGTDRWILPRGSRLSALLPFSPDILLCHLEVGLSAGIALSHTLKVPIIYGVHHSCLPGVKRIRKRLKRVRGVVFRSPSIGRRFLAECPVSVPTSCVYSGIEESLILPGRKISFSTDKPVALMTACNLGKEKGVDTVLFALKELSREWKFRFTIVGDGPERGNLEALAESLGLRESVHFTGSLPREACIDLMSRSDLFIMVSAPETFGLVYIEALARGALVVGSEGWGIDGVIEDGVSGYLIPPGDPSILANRLRTILSRDPEPVLRGGHRLVSSLTRKRVAESYLGFIKKVIMNAPPPD